MRNSEVETRLTSLIVTQHLCCQDDKCGTRHFIQSQVILFFFSLHVDWVSPFRGADVADSVSINVSVSSFLYTL
jgi:hypothetical protein